MLLLSLMSVVVLAGFVSNRLTPIAKTNTIGEGSDSTGSHELVASQFAFAFNSSKHSSNQEKVRPYVGAANGKTFMLQEKLNGVEIRPLKTSLPVFKAFGISADVTKILYTSLKGGVPSGELFLEDLSTGQLLKISQHLVLEAAWSPTDENRIAYTFAGGESFGLAMVELDSHRVTTLVRGGVFTEFLQWDESGAEIHYLETTDLNARLQLTARFVAVGKLQKRWKSALEIPAGFPMPADQSFLADNLQIFGHDGTFDSDKDYAFRTLAPDGEHEIGGDNLLGNSPLYVRSRLAPAITNLGDGKLLRVLRDGIVVRRSISQGARLEYVSFEGKTVSLSVTTVGYNLPIGNAKLVQGGQGYSSPGNCRVGSHTSAMAFAYDLEASVSAPILAAADGLVVYSTSTVTCNTIDPDCPDYSASGCPGSFFGNLVIVQHADGTYTKYAHMETASPQAAVGTSVCQGLYIGRQGHTGTTKGSFNKCGDHLHFQRQTSPDIFGQSIAVEFSDTPGNPLTCNTRYSSNSTQQSHSIAPTTESFELSGGTGLVTVTSSGCNWTATSNDSWLTITSPASGAGNGNDEVIFTVADNSDSGFRVGTITIAGHIFTVSQDGGGVSNQAPTVNAGSDETVVLPNSAFLNGSALDDGLPNPPAALTTTWSQVSGPGTVTFANADALNTTASFSLAGVYLLRLTVSDGALFSSDDLRITVNIVNGGGSLSGSLGTATASVNLTSNGITDWAHWGLNSEVSFDHKSGVTSGISNYTKIGPISVLRLTGATTNYIWTDGTPTTTANTTTGIALYGTGNGFELTVPAETTMQTLKLYLGVLKARGRLEATLSDGSSSPFIDTSLVNTTGTTESVYSLYFQATTNAILTIRWTVDGNNLPHGQVRLQAASLVDTPGLLSVSNATSPASVDLATEGTADWAHWGLSSASSFNHKNGVTSQISNYTKIGTVGVKRQLQTPTSYSWIGGKPTATASNTTTGVYLTGTGNGFRLTVPADTTARTLKLYVGLWAAQGRLEATLSDGSAPAFVDTSVINQTATSNAVYMLNYRAGTSGQTLTLRWTMNASFNALGNITLQAATLVINGGSQVNQAPAVSAGNDQTISLPNNVSLNGTASDDGQPNPPATMTTTWSQVSGPGTANFANVNALNTTANFTSAGVYTLRLTASDSSLSSSDDLVVTVNPANQAPTVSAGSDQTISVPNNASLTGTASDDGQPNPPATMTTTWSQVSGPGTANFANVNALNTTASFTSAGVYTLRLTASDSSLSSSDDLTITVNPASVPGFLSGSISASPASVDLATEGTADWAHWGLSSASSFNHKSGVTSQISNYTKIGTVGVKRQLQSPTSYSWTGGTPTATASNTTTGVYLTGTGNGFRLTVPADTTARTLKLYVGLWAAQGRLEATLSDGSAPAFVDTSVINQTATSNAVYMLNYQAGTSGQTLTLRWTVNASFNTFGNVTLQAATLLGSNPSPAPASEFQISSTAPFRQLVTHTARDQNGNFVAVWQSDGQDGSGWGIFARRYNAAGVPQGGEFKVNTLTAGHQFVPRVAMDAIGNFVIVWESEGQDGDGYGISCQRYNAAGVPQGIELRVNTTIPNNQLDPFIAMAPNGNFVVAWTSDLQDGSLGGMFAQRFDASGIPQGGEFQVNTFTADLQKAASASMDANGNFVIVWQSQGQDGSGLGCYGQLFDSAGVPQGGEFRINTTTVGDQLGSFVAMATNGDFVIVWTSAVQDGDGKGIFGQRYSAAGVPQGGEFQVNTFTTNDQRNGSIAMNAGGNFVVVWESLSQDGSGKGIYGERFNALGVPQGGEFLVNSYTLGDQAFPFVAMDAGGNFVVTWTSTGQDVSGDAVFGKRFDAAGNPLNHP